MAASLAACAPPIPPEGGPSPEEPGTPPEAPVTGQGQAAPATTGTAPNPPEVGDLVDPARLRSENWQEPWTWRPEH